MGPAALVVKLFEPLGSRDEAAVTEEGVRLLRFVVADTDGHDIRFHSVDGVRCSRARPTRPRRNP
ncbi:hypothetical protein [Streptosporangium subroseum]|uniref:hypothetical protein n=1 Tax=Streptosporangium subroseum TaxID=106412 RepID=UPI000B78B4EE|nr:hypothetical protein [Streptosporangium subroseum]